MILTYLFTSVIIMIMAGYLADGLTYRWTWGYRLRDKFNILNKKPFSCGGCMTMWLTLLPLCYLFSAQEYIFFGLNIGLVPALCAYILYRVVENKID
tara:strand:+ start:3376 stop:3666 length:291 start_codon:yes stop_codon:yes gene_type:complete